jgi:polyvinyl alcohol dehydrogenase (cytochrome)
MFWSPVIGQDRWTIVLHAFEILEYFQTAELYCQESSRLSQCSKTVGGVEMPESMTGAESVPESPGAGVDPVAVALAFGGASQERAAAFLKMQEPFIDDQRHHLHEQFKRVTMGVISDRLSIALKLLTATGLALALMPAGRAAASPAVGADGSAVYSKRCAGCHDQTSARIPPRSALENLSPSHILKVLDFGVMMAIAYPVTRDEREAVARYLGKGADDPPPPASAFCRPGRRIMAGPVRDSWEGWSPSSENARFQPADRAGLNPADVPRLKLKWAFGFSGDVTAFGAPIVLNGTIFIGSAGGAVQALDAKSGCIHWLYQASGPVRSAIGVSRDAGGITLVFSDQNGWVHALDARSGKQRWKRRVEEHEGTRLTGSPVIHDGVAFIPAASWEESRSLDSSYPCCTFRGSVTALRVRDGTVVWKRYLVDPPKRTGATAAGTPTFGPSGAGIWSAPTVDAKRGLLYVTSGDNYSHPATATSDAVLALDLKTGKIMWSVQTRAEDVFNSSCLSKSVNCPDDSGPDYDFGASAILTTNVSNKDVLVAGQKSGMVYALDPDAKGKILWQTRVGKGGANGGVQWGMASDGRNVYAAASDLKRQSAKGGAVVTGNADLDPNQGGGLTALDLITGNRVWFMPGYACTPPRPVAAPRSPPR